MHDYEALTPELEDLANEIGNFILYWGFKKIHGRLWTLLYLSDQALDAGQLIRRLQVSKALVSITLSDLLHYGVILESGKSSRGTQTYIANPNVLDTILKVLRERERKMIANAQTSHQLLATLPSEIKERAALNGERVEALGRMIRQAQNALSSLLELTTFDFKSSPLE